jgi:hypothetical protein
MGYFFEMVAWASKQNKPFLKRLPGVRGERTRGLSISFIFSFFTTLPPSHSGTKQNFVVQ